MKHHLKFIGGPWDGEYHEVESGHDCLHVVQPLKVSFKIEPVDEPVLDEKGEPVLDENGEPVTRMIKPEPGQYTRYTIRHMAGEGGNVYWYSPDDWPDIFTISQLVHHYPGRAR